MLAKTTFQCPEQRCADGGVIGSFHAVIDVALGKCTRCRQYGFEVTKSVNDGRHYGHQLAALLLHITAKQRLNGWRHFEKPTVEQRGGLLRDGLELQEAVLDRFYLVWRHKRLRHPAC